MGVGVASKPCPDNIRGIDYDTSSKCGDVFSAVS